MADLSLVAPSEPVLKQDADPWVFEDGPSAREFADEMFAFMISQRGIGLAAPQIGINKRVFVMGNNVARFNVFNPQIVKAEEEEYAEEGCLTFPLLYLGVRRYKKISVVFQNENANIIERDFDGIMARCFQHELDHLNGVLFVDYASKLKLDMAIKKRDKILRKAKNVAY